MSEGESWDQYSRLVLQQLETLSNGIEGLRTELQDVKNQLTELKAKEDRIQDLKEWKDKIDDVASPSQLQNALQEIESLKTFKTKAVTIFAGVQFLMAGAFAVSKFFG
jgi:Tfp pilus assembly protein PilO